MARHEIEPRVDSRTSVFSEVTHVFPTPAGFYELVESARQFELRQTEVGEFESRQEGPAEHVVFSRDRFNRPKTSDQRPKASSWKPFNLDPQVSQRFVNLYGGPYSAQMELNRANAERVIEVAGLEGKIILADLTMNRTRSVAGINPDGSVTRRRGLFWGERIDEERTREFVRSVPEGWRIEIPGQEILDNLTREESKEPLDHRFVARVNQVVRSAITQIILRERLTFEKLPRQPLRYGITAGPLPFLVYDIFSKGVTQGILTELPSALVYFALINVTDRIFNVTKKPVRVNGKYLYEYIMPPIEIDRVIRGIAFANFKGRNLVRLKGKS